jgi:hypothetical protein
MKAQKSIMFAIVNKKAKYVRYYSLKWTKKDCISDFIGGSCLTWNETKKHGWTCIKVEVVVSPVKSEDEREEIKTDRNANVVSSFMEHCKENGIEIPDSLFESYFDA